MMPFSTAVLVVSALAQVRVDIMEKSAAACPSGLRPRLPPWGSVFRRANRMLQQKYVMQRTEDRIDMKVTALLVGKQDKLGVETGVTEDVSSRGARIISATEWPLGETILVAIPGFHFTAA